MTTYHERDRETGLDYRGARFYDSDVGRFLSLDPLAADYAGWSPYNYVLGNPVKFVDPDGRAVTDPPRHKATAVMVAHRNSTKETTISMVRNSTTTYYNEKNQKVIVRNSSEQTLHTNDKGEVNGFTSSWKTTTSVDGKLDKDKTVTGGSSDFEAVGDVQLKRATRIIAGIHEKGIEGGADESPLNIVGMSNNPVSETDLKKAGLSGTVSSIVGKTSHPVLGVTVGILMAAVNNKGGNFDFSNTAVLVKDYMDTGGVPYSAGQNTYTRGGEATMVQSGAMYDSKINQYETDR